MKSCAPLRTLLALAAIALADTGSTAEPLRLADVVALAHERNPRIAAARARAEAARLIPARVAALDDPVFSWEAWNAPESFDLRRADNNILRLSQRIPFPGKLAAARAEAVSGAAEAGFAAAAIEVEVLADVRKELAGLWRVHHEVHVYDRDLELARRFARAAESKYGLGEATQTDVLRAQVELTRLVTRSATARLAVRSAAARLNALLSRPAAEPLGDPEEPTLGELPADPGALVAVGIERRPDLRAERAATATREASLRLAGFARRPELEVGVARFLNDRQSDGFGVMASVTLPFAVPARIDAAIGEAASRLTAARADVRALEDRVAAEVTEAWLAAQTAKLRRDLYLGTHIPQADQALRSAASAYETGSIDFTGWIETFRELEAVHLEHVEASAMLGVAAADLERAIGGSLDQALAELTVTLEEKP